MQKFHFCRITDILDGDIVGVDILRDSIMGVDIMGVDILRSNQKYC